MSNCPNALRCPHAAVEPPEPYVQARTIADHGSIAQEFRGWPWRHVAAIVRARAEFGTRSRDMARRATTRRWTA